MGSEGFTSKPWRQKVCKKGGHHSLGSLSLMPNHSKEDSVVGPGSPEPLPGALWICFGGWAALTANCALSPHLPLLEGNSLQLLSLFPFDLWFSCHAVDRLGRMWPGPWGKEGCGDQRKCQTPREPTGPPQGVLGGSGMATMALGSWT